MQKSKKKPSGKRVSVKAWGAFMPSFVFPMRIFEQGVYTLRSATRRAKEEYGGGIIMREGTFTYTPGDSREKE